MLEFLDHDSGAESMESLPVFWQKVIRKLVGTGGLSEPLSLNVWFCRRCGMWIDSHKKWQSFAYNFALVIPQMANFAFLFTNLYVNMHSLPAVVENLMYSVISLVGIYIGFIFLMNVDSLKRLIDDLKILNGKVNMHRRVAGIERKVRLLTNGFSLYAVAGCTFYVLGPIFNKKSCSTTGAMVCGLPTAGSFPYDVHRFPMFQLTFILHTYCAFNSIFVILSSITFLVGIVTHICAHLDEIKANLKVICEANHRGNFDIDRYNKLQKIIFHHSEILDFAGKASENFSSMMFIQSTAVPLLISVLTFLILLSTKGKAIAFLDPYTFRIVLTLGGWIIELLLLSVLGQKVIDESDEIADVAYNILWYNENVVFQKHILLMILRSRRTISLTVASMGKVSLMLFSRVISSSYSYFTILYDLIIKAAD